MYIDATRVDIVAQPDELERVLDELILILLMSLCFHAFLLVSGLFIGRLKKYSLHGSKNNLH